MNYFTSDMHFFHERLLGENDFAPRLFANVDEDRKSVVQGKSVDLGGRRIIKKKKKKKTDI